MGPYGRHPANYRLGYSLTYGYVRLWPRNGIPPDCVRIIKFHGQKAGPYTETGQALLPEYWALPRLNPKGTLYG